MAKEQIPSEVWGKLSDSEKKVIRLLRKNIVYPNNQILKSITFERLLSSENWESEFDFSIRIITTEGYEVIARVRVCKDENEFDKFKKGRKLAPNDFVVISENNNGKIKRIIVGLAQRCLEKMGFLPSNTSLDDSLPRRSKI